MWAVKGCLQGSAGSATLTQDDKNSANVGAVKLHKELAAKVTCKTPVQGLECHSSQVILMVKCINRRKDLSKTLLSSVYKTGELELP